MSVIGTYVEGDYEYRVAVKVELRQPKPEVERETVQHERISAADQIELSVTHALHERRAHGRRAASSWQDTRGGAGAAAALLVTEYAEGWDRGRAEKVAALGERWHMNCLMAGCAHQTVVYETGKYGQRQPSLDLTPPCPLTGYRYGHAWLVEPLPADVLALARSFQ